jgi:hypothetical protein
MGNVRASVPYAIILHGIAKEFHGVSGEEESVLPLLNIVF